MEQGILYKRYQNAAAAWEASQLRRDRSSRTATGSPAHLVITSIQPDRVLPPGTALEGAAEETSTPETVTTALPRGFLVRDFQHVGGRSPCHFWTSWYDTWSDSQEQGVLFCMIHNTTRSRGRPRSFDELAALEKATQVFWSKGYDGVTIDDLVGRDGCGTDEPVCRLRGQADVVLARPQGVCRNERGSPCEGNLLAAASSRLARQPS
jgi:hypothetical protein